MAEHVSYRFVCAEDAESEALKHAVGGNIRRLRHEQGMTKAQFAHICGLSRPFLDRIEGGAADIRISYLNLFADVLCVNPSDLLAPLESGGDTDANGARHRRS